MSDEVKRDEKVMAVQKAVSNLIIKLGYEADIVAEGAMKGAAASLIATGSSVESVGTVFEDFGEALKNVDDREDHPLN